MEKFKLNDLFHLTEDEMRKYKIHLAAYNGYEQPLDVFARDREEWKGWNEWRGGKDDFNREYIIGLKKSREPLKQMREYNTPSLFFHF